MPLDYKLPAPHERFLTEKGEVRGDVRTIILYAMPTGSGPLRTREDAVTLWARACILSRLSEYGARDEAFPLETALSLVGLDVNVPKETDASFLRRVGQAAMRDLRRKAAEKED